MNILLEKFKNNILYIYSYEIKSRIKKIPRKLLFYLKSNIKSILAKSIWVWSITNIWFVYILWFI